MAWPDRLVQLVTRQPWLAFTCPTCGRTPGYPCTDPDGVVLDAHTARVRIGQEAARATQTLQMATQPTTSDDTRSEDRAGVRALIDQIWRDHPQWARPDTSHGASR